MEDDVSSGPGIVLPPEETPVFVCADIRRRKGRPHKNGTSCLKEFKDTGRCEFHYNKLTGGLVSTGKRVCHYLGCQHSPPSELINFCGDEAHKIRADSQGVRYCKTPLCLSILSPGGPEYHCILHEQAPARARPSKARTVQEDTTCTWDGKCQETIADPDSMFCGIHHQKSKARQEAVNKAKQEKKQPPVIDLVTVQETKQEKKQQEQPPMIDIITVQETKEVPEQQETKQSPMIDIITIQETKQEKPPQSEVDKLRAENEALQRQLKLNSSIAFMCNKTDMLKSFNRQAEYLKCLYLPKEQHKEILGHLDAMHHLVKEFAGRRV
jgi:hypothetical protein